MPENDQKAAYWPDIPTELLVYIFTYLPAKELTKCRQVCVRWMCVIDDLRKSDLLWSRHCKKDFKTVYKTAEVKSRVGMGWFNIYKSLALWPKLNLARELRDEFASASKVIEEIMDFRVLQNGIIGVHKKCGIYYYDIETLELTKQSPITGNYLRYSENTDTIIILNFQLHLIIFRKVLENAQMEGVVSFLDVKSYILADRTLYFVTLEDEIYQVDLNSDSLRCDCLQRSPNENVMCLGYTDKLNLLTFERNIYTLTPNGLVFTANLGPATNILHTLKQYNFLEHLDWRVYFQWMYVLNHTIPQGPLRDIIVIRTYGDIIFVGSNWGVLRIYYSPYNGDEFDLYNCEPVKQYNFMERSDCPVLSDLCPIIQIDVLESEDGHTVLAAMPKKLAILDYVHNFKRSATFAMLPYRDVQRVKILKIDDSV